MAIVIGSIQTISIMKIIHATNQCNYAHIHALFYAAYSNAHRGRLSLDHSQFRLIICRNNFDKFTHPLCRYRHKIRASPTIFEDMVNWFVFDKKKRFFSSNKNQNHWYKNIYIRV